MAINKYFKNHTSVKEQKLINDLTVEGIQIAGMDVYYIPRNAVDEDYLFGEDPVSSFNTYYTIEAYLLSVDGFGADLDIIDKFGLSVNESANFEISKTRFASVTGMTRPNEGDLIYIPMTKSLMEIKKAKKDDPFYQRGETYVFNITVELFEYSQEDISTGISDIDDLINTFDVVADVNNDPASDNDAIESEGDLYRDSSESNPHGNF